MFQIKICGIKNPADALAAIDAGVDALGLNFYPPSKRYLSIKDAVGVVDVIPPQVARVGVFVNAPRAQISQAIEMLSLDWVQLHGSETPEFLACLPASIRLIRACRTGKGGLSAVVDDLHRCREAGRVPDAVLIDALVAGEFGGTGAQADWDSFMDWENVIGPIPLILAGGLEAGNVIAAIDQVAPTGVDTASGVESSPGCKDPERMRQFVTAARYALKKRNK
jgi:phosphoribosylanthranilate isomerase